MSDLKLTLKACNSRKM